ncbi:putative acid phosphatase domain protein [Rhodococcus sp. MTM3W5.2]|nr:putative acid phosphatase domain protein [Rhodococcus sp. MTM3W5.2]
MLAFSGQPDRPSLRALILHDDADREFDYVAGAEQALDHAREKNWTVVSMKNDWTNVFSSAVT